MALQLDFNVIEAPSNKEIWIYDNTGIYHSVNNPTGWGGINPNFSNVSTCTVTVTMPDPVTLKPSTDPSLTFILPATPLPNVIGNRLVIVNTSLGLLTDQQFIDGQYGFQIDCSGTFNAEPFSVSWKASFVFSNILCCCAKTKMAEADLESCGCAPCREKLFDLLLLQLGVQGVIANNDCAKPNQALEILKVATGICNNENCVGCN